MNNDSQKPTYSPPKAPTKKLITFNETFESSIVDKPQKFLLDRTLVQGIKQNDSSKIVQNGEQSDIRAQDLPNEQEQISQIFINTRKKYDQIKEITVKIEQSIQKHKKQKEQLQTQKSLIQTNFSQESKGFKNIQSQLSNFQHMCEDSQLMKDIRLQMVQVLKRDILYYKKNCFQANSKIVRNHNKLKTLTEQFQSSRKVSTNCRSLIYSIQRKINSKQNERSQKIGSVYQIINKKAENVQKRQQRTKMIQNSMLSALNDKMPQQQEQKRLLLVNICFKRMLKLKMSRQMFRFNQIQLTFRKIKQHTTVKHAQQFIQKFINRQKNYGQLLESINKNEQKITNLKQQKQKLEKQSHDLNYLKQSIQEEQHQRKGFFNKKTNQSIDLLREKLLANQGLKNKCFSWANKFLINFDAKEDQINTNTNISKNKPDLCLKQCLNKLNKFLDHQIKAQSLQEQSKLKQIYVSQKNLSLPQKIKSKNTRIRTQSNYDENANSRFDDHDIAYDDISEIEYLNQNRKVVKKSCYLRNRMKTRAN